MPTTIDSLQIEIQSSSTSASAGIRDLAKSLGELKGSGTVTTAIKNLGKLSDALRGFTDASNATRSIGKLAGALGSLKNIGSVSNVGNSLTKLGSSLQAIGGVNIDNIAPKLAAIATALKPLSEVKAGGINTMVNGLKKIGEVTEKLDDKTIDAFADRIKKLNDVLEPLSTKMTTIQVGLRGFSSAARSAGSSAKQMGSDVNTGALNFATITHAIQTVWQWLNQVIQKFSEFMFQAIEWDGIAARFGRGFGNQAQETYEWIQRLNEEMGINVQQFMQYSSIYATMLTGFGVAMEDAGKMALGYTELTYDIWAGYNDVYKNFSDAAEAVKSAIAGEVEPIRRAGFTIVEATLEQTAANHGLNVSLEKATEAQKSYLRYLTLVDQAHSQNLVGTYAKELNTAEGLMRTFAQQLKSLAQAFGSLFLPILVRVMPYLQAFVELLTEGVRALARLFGFEIQEVNWSTSLDGMAGSANNATDALDSATKAAKELKNATVGIDELNVISPPSASSAGGAGGAGDGFSGLNVDSLWDASIFDGVKSKVSDIVQKMKDWLGLTGDIDTWGEFFETRLGRILKIVGKIGLAIAAWKVTKGFLDAISSMKTLLSSPQYSIALSAILTITGITFAFDGMSDAWKNSLDGFNFAEIVGGGLLTTGGVAILGSKIATWLGNAFASPKIAFALAEMGKNLGLVTSEAVGAALGAGISGIILGIPMMFVGIRDAIKEGLNWLNGILIPAGATAAGAGIGTIIGSLGGPIGAGIGALIGLAVGLVTDGVILIIQEWESISAWFKKMGSNISTWWNGSIAPFFTKTIPNFFKNEIPKAFNSATTAISNWWIGLLGTVQSGWNNVKNWWDNSKAKLADYTPNIGSIKNKLSAAWTTAKTWWDKSKAKLADYTPNIGSIKNKVSSAWSTAKTWWEKSKAKLADYTPNIGSIKNKVSSAWTTARNWWNKSKSSFNTYTPTIGSITNSLKTAWDNAKKWWKNNVKGLSTKFDLKVPTLTIKWGSVKVLGTKIDFPKGFDVKFAADGGIFDMGSLIWAGERGPEIVAGAGGGRTGVMNVQQMQDAVYEGVYGAVLAAMRANNGGSNGGQAVNVYLDGRQVTAAVEQRQRERGASIMGSQIYSY